MRTPDPHATPCVPCSQVRAVRGRHKQVTPAFHMKQKHAPSSIHPHQLLLLLIPNKLLPVFHRKRKTKGKTYSIRPSSPLFPPPPPPTPHRPTSIRNATDPELAPPRRDNTVIVRQDQTGCGLMACRYFWDGRSSSIRHHHLQSPTHHRLPPASLKKQWDRQ